jgi:hypothetical protein
MTTTTTGRALDAIAWGRAPRHDWGSVNLRVVCADGFMVSVQASPMHYAHDQQGAPYWRDPDPEVAYPFKTFEIGNPSSAPKPRSAWAEYDNGGVWAWVPREIVAALLDNHGGAVGWEPTS